MNLMYLQKSFQKSLELHFLAVMQTPASEV